MRIQKAVKLTERRLLTDSDAVNWMDVPLRDHLTCSRSYPMLIEAMHQPIAEALASCDDRDREITDLLSYSELRNVYGSVSIKNATHKGTFPFNRDFGPSDYQAFSLDQSNASEPVRNPRRGEVHSPGTGSAMRNNVGLVNETADRLQKWKVFRVQVNGIAMQIAITPDKTDQPGHLVRPVVEERLIEGIAEDCLSFAPGGSATKLCATAHWLAVRNSRTKNIVVGDARTAGRTIAVDIAVPRSLELNPALLAAVSPDTPHEYVLSHFNRCHLSIDRPHHLAKQKQNREARQRERQPILPGVEEG